MYFIKSTYIVCTALKLSTRNSVPYKKLYKRMRLATTTNLAFWARKNFNKLWFSALSRDATFLYRSPKNVLAFGRKSDKIDKIRNAPEIWFVGRLAARSDEWLDIAEHFLIDSFFLRAFHFFRPIFTQQEEMGSDFGVSFFRASRVCLIRISSAMEIKKPLQYLLSDQRSPGEIEEKLPQQISTRKKKRFSGISGFPSN